jgi:hypothetical protein
VLESQLAVFLVYGYPEPGVVHHTQHTPVHIARLHTHGLVHDSHDDVDSLFQLGDADFHVPETPAKRRLAPIHV